MSSRGNLFPQQLHGFLYLCLIGSSINDWIWRWPWSCFMVTAMTVMALLLRFRHDHVISHFLIWIGHFLDVQCGGTLFTARYSLVDVHCIQLKGSCRLRLYSRLVCLVLWLPVSVFLYAWTHAYISFQWLECWIVVILCRILLWCWQLLFMVCPFSLASLV